MTSEQLLPRSFIEFMNTNCDIICFTLSRWDSAISSPSLSLAKEFAKNNRVWYIEHPYSWKDYLRERNTEAVQSRKKALLKGLDIYTNPPSLPSNITIVTSKLTIPINFLPAGFLYDNLSSINDRVILKTIRRLIQDKGIKDFIYVNFFDPYFVRKLPPDIKALRTVYQSMDDISQVAYSKKHGERLEEEIIGNFDYTLCTSRELTRLKSRFSPNVHFSPNAVDIDIFERATREKLPKPKELENLKGKIIGFTGSIEYRSDFELLKRIAAYHQDKTLFFVGPINTEDTVIAELRKMPNVVFAGPRKITELPAFLQYFDCTIIPYRKNALTKSIYPLKINEYLAAGKPVISTNFSEDIKSFAAVAYIVDTQEEFLKEIDKAIQEDNINLKQARLMVAKENTWAVRIKQFWDIISKDPLPQARNI
jgi:teichuronic acid biosynthesis glycosyltransferase TuaH